ncbi:MAG TPA: DoxX family protein [Pseudolabrys sp.]|nr:DoxX family protein [Pseudolabrys sp.]
MPKNPLTDAWQFLTATTSDYLDLGAWRFLILALFWALALASVTIAVLNWKEDPAQRTGRHIGICAVRVLIGCMWFEGMLWKLPLPLSGGLQYWTEQEATRAAFEFHRVFVKDFLLPNLSLLGPFVFLAELTFATSLILGLAVRFVSVLAIAFVLQLWLGIYRPGDPAEWPWSYVFLAMLLFLFALEGAGRYLGLDAWLRRNVPAVRDKKGLLGQLLHAAS